MKRRPWHKKRFSHRDTNHPRLCLSSIVIPEPGHADRAVRIVACTREHAHEGRHRNRRAGMWTDEESAAMDELWAAHDRWIGGGLTYLGHQKRQPGWRRA